MVDLLCHFRVNIPSHGPLKVFRQLQAFGVSTWSEDKFLPSTIPKGFCKDHDYNHFSLLIKSFIFKLSTLSTIQLTCIFFFSH